MTTQRPKLTESQDGLQADTLHVRRERAELCIAKFLDHCKNSSERRFWVGRAYDTLKFKGIVPEGVRLSGPMSRLSMSTCPLLAIVAMYWRQETSSNCSIFDEKVLQSWYEQYSSESLGIGWEPRAPRVVLAKAEAAAMKKAIEWAETKFGL